MFGMFKKKKLRPHQQEAVDRLRRGTRSTTTAPAPSRREQDDGENFALSMAVGAATDNALLGYAAGGSMSGGLVGATLSGSIHEQPSPTHDSSPSYDSGSCGSSYDTGSSFDGGSCGGSDSSF